MKNFEHLRGIISSLVNEGVTIPLYSEQTQSLIDRDDVVLWNTDSSTMSDEAYEELCTSIRKSSTKYYNSSSVLSYPDFCISLVCCVSYSLNHKVTNSIKERAYTSAWRLLEGLYIAGGDNISSWLKQNIGDRSASGYASILEVDVGFSMASRHKASFRFDSNRELLSDLIVDATMQNKARRLDDSTGFDRWSIVPGDELRILNVEREVRR